jgi:hypothetical protein
MEVVQIGDVTGKNVGSVIYTTPYFWNRKQKPNHRYAMQPIVLKSSMQTVSRLFQRTKANLPTERKLRKFDVWEVLLTLLSTAIGKITGTGKMLKQSPERIKLFYRC